MVLYREIPAVGVDHEVGDRHFAARKKSGDTSEQTECDQEAASQFDDGPNPAQCVSRRAMTPRRKTEDLLAAVTSKHESNNESGDAINRIGVTIESIHVREVAANPTFMSSLASTPIEQKEAKVRDG